MYTKCIIIGVDNPELVDILRIANQLAILRLATLRLAILRVPALLVFPVFHQKILRNDPVKAKTVRAV